MERTESLTTFFLAFHRLLPSCLAEPSQTDLSFTTTNKHSPCVPNRAELTPFSVIPLPLFTYFRNCLSSHTSTSKSSQALHRTIKSTLLINIPRFLKMRLISPAHNLTLYLEVQLSICHLAPPPSSPTRLSRSHTTTFSPARPFVIFIIDQLGTQPYSSTLTFDLRSALFLHQSFSRYHTPTTSSARPFITFIFFSLKSKIQNSSAHPEKFNFTTSFSAVLFVFRPFPFPSYLRPYRPHLAPSSSTRLPKRVHSLAASVLPPSTLPLHQRTKKFSS